MSTIEDTIVTVSVEAIHSLAQEMVEKVIAAQKNEVDEMIKEAERYVSELKNGMNLNNVIVGQGNMKEIDDNDDIKKIQIKRAVTSLSDNIKINDEENILARAKKQQTNYYELIEQFERYCKKMHSSADEIEAETIGLMDEIEWLTEDENIDSEVDDEISTIDKLGTDLDEEVEGVEISNKGNSETLDEEASLEALFKEYGIPVPSDLEALLNGKDTPTPTPTPTSTIETPSDTPTEMPTIEEPTVEPQPVVSYSGGNNYTNNTQPATVAPEPVPAIDNVVQGKAIEKIPTSSKPIAKVETKVQTKSSAGAIISTTSGIATAAVLGLGAKAYLDRKKSEEEDKEAEKLL